MALRGQVEQERVACSNLRRELQIEQSRCLLLEKHLQDVRQELEQSSLQQDVSSQEKTRLEHLLNVAESRLAESQAELDKERSRSSKQLDELNRRHETDAARDRTFISDLRAQLDQERRQSEELASEADRLRGELLHRRRKWEEQERALREETLREQEAVTRQKVALEMTLRLYGWSAWRLYFPSQWSLGRPRINCLEGFHCLQSSYQKTYKTIDPGTL
uniref:Uncharacterized protein n=1 Tax=Neogobius melanostomus TaxID=47308 RepID=A0A8C6TST3_9GOBI